MRYFGVPLGAMMVGLAAACGGGDSGTGPGGGGGGTGTYALIGANDDPVPAIVLSNVCPAVRIENGRLQLGGDGTFQMRFDYVDETGAADWTGDHGSYDRDGDDLTFESEAWGDTFEGEVDDGVIYVWYDFCGDGEAGDLELAFSR
jgi:hypothetical protein